MINNINTLQKLPESAKLQTYTDVYLKQSLANLGQRFSIKGDGVQAGEFSLYELFGHEYDEAERINSYIKAEVSKDKIILSCFDDKDDELPSEVLPIYGSSKYVTTEKIVLPGTPILNSAYYAAGGIITKYDEAYRILFAGYDNDDLIQEIICDRFNVESKLIEDGFRIYSSDGKVRAIRVHVKPHTHSVDKLYEIKTYEAANDALTLEEVNDMIFDGMSEESVEYIIDSLVDNGFFIQTGTYDATYNEDGNQYIHFDSDIKNVSAEYEMYVNAFAYDINELFPYIIEYYNNHIYFSSSDSMALRRELVIAIFNKVFADFESQSVYDTVESISIYMPYDYKLVYSCNSNNPVYIYNSLRDITIEFTVDPLDDLYKIVGVNSEQLMICDSTDTINIEDKFVVYEYQISYSKESVVDDILVERKYVLPYIDNNGYWCINDVTTSIYARGKVGGQPNVIMTYTDCTLFDGGREVMTSFKRDEITNLDWQEVKYMVRPLDTADNISSSNYHIMSTYMPTNIKSLNENLVAWLENSLIININSVHSELTDESTNASTLQQNLGPNGIVPTFWIMEKKKNKDATGEEDDDYIYEFSYVKQPNQAWAVDTNYLNNTESVVKHYMNFGIEPDNYEHTWVVMDKLSTQFKNSYLDRNISVWPVMRNLSRDDFNQEFVSDISFTSKYENDANLIFAFYDNVTRAEGTGYINGVSQLPETKYMSISDDHKIDSYVNYKNYPLELVPNAYIRDYENVAQTIVPVMDLKELFLRNLTVFNRYNVFSVDNSRSVYNAYFGVPFDSEDKSIVRIGTSNVNPNIGTETLMTDEDKANFKTHKEIAIDFDKVHINGITHFKATTWNHTPIGESSHIYKTTVSPSYVGDLKQIEYLEDMKDNMFGYVHTTVFFGSDIAPARSGNVCYMNVNKALEDLNIVGFTGYSKIVGDPEMMTYIDNEDGTGFYALQLTTDLTKDNSKFAYELGAVNVMTNPFEISYFIPEVGKDMTVSIREEITTNSILGLYGIGRLGVKYLGPFVRDNFIDDEDRQFMDEVTLSDLEIHYDPISLF